MAYGDISFNGVAGEYVSFKTALDTTAAAALVGKPVSIDSTGIVAATDASFVLGVCILAEKDGVLNIQTGGFAKVLFTGVTTAAIGKKFVGATDGGIRTPVTATAADVVAARGVVVAIGTNEAWIRL
jgi:hypothetical protein